MIDTSSKKTIEDLRSPVDNAFQAAGPKILSLHQRWNSSDGTPVFTVAGRYTSRGWTEWTQGFQFGMAILQFDTTRDEEFLTLGRSKTLDAMAPHLTHIGVHDHGFNNVSTYGNLRRLLREGSLPADEWEQNFYELALKVTGAVQAARWTPLPNGLGFVHSFNGPHSLFADTIRSMRALALSHTLGHRLIGEMDAQVNLLHRLLTHAETTAKFNVYFGNGRDAYDLRGRVAHESVFNTTDGAYRCPNSQQGYSPFSTWTRGLAWILCGYPELLEFLATLEAGEFPEDSSKEAVLHRFEEVARAVADFYISQTPVDGIPYWDTGAPGLSNLGDYLDRPADPFNSHEPVDSSAAAISAQGLLRLADYLDSKGDTADAVEYRQAGITTASTLFSDSYLSSDPAHEGLILHSVYHRPNGWDHIPEGRKVPCGESSMWGDYHALELAVYLQRKLNNQPEYSFFT